MKKELYEIWKVKEGSKTLWKVQFPGGILSVRTKAIAEKYVKAFNIK